MKSNFTKNRNFIATAFFLFALVIALIIFAFTVNAQFGPGQNFGTSSLVGGSRYLYVNTTNGNNFSGTPGNIALPYQTIFAAIAAANTNGDTIFVQPGVYQETALTNKPNLTFYFSPGSIVSNSSSVATFSSCRNLLVIRGFGSFTNGQFFSSTFAGFDVECDSLINKNPTSGSLVDSYQGNSRVRARLINPGDFGSFGFEHPGGTTILSIYDATIYQCCLADLGVLNLYNCVWTNDTQLAGCGGHVNVYGGSLSANWSIGPNTGSVRLYDTVIDTVNSVPGNGVTLFGTYFISGVSWGSLPGGFTNLVVATTGIRTVGIAPTVVTNNAMAGNGATVTLNATANDSVFDVDLLSSATPVATATNLTVTFKAVKVNTPHVYFTARNQNSAIKMTALYVTNITTSGFNFAVGAAALTASTLYQYSFWVIE